MGNRVEHFALGAEKKGGSCRPSEDERPLDTAARRAEAGDVGDVAAPSTAGYVAAMIAPLERVQVLHVAKLARLTLRDDEVPRVTEQLTKILGHLAQLAELDVDGVEPTAQVGVDRLPLRPDVPRPGVPHDVAMAQAPETIDGGFAVPAFIDE